MMRYRRVLTALFAVSLLSIVAAAQRKTVTNADLEKFRDKRIQAERQLEEYYAKRGLTMAEVDRQDAEDAKAREELSLKLRKARLERERVENEARARDYAAALARERQSVVMPQQTFDYGLGGYIFYGNRWVQVPVWGNQWRRHSDGISWRATPMGVIYEPGSRPSSIWSPPFGGRPQPLRRP